MQTRILHLSLWGALVLLVVVTTTASAQVRQSTNYRIQSDSLNVGGDLSSSASYTLEDTTGEVATGESSSNSYNLKAGYQQMQEVYLALTGGADVTMSPSLGGVTGGTSNGSVTFTATTDGPAGYQLKIHASTTPAMQSGANSIADYSPSGGVPDFTLGTDASDAHFAFSPEGDDIVTRYQDSGGVCNSAGGDTAFACWDGLSTSERVIASASSANHPTGADTTIRFRVWIGGSVAQPPGTYTATTTVTLIAL